MKHYRTSFKTLVLVLALLLAPLPQRAEAACTADMERWHRAVERSRSWIENDV